MEIEQSNYFGYIRNEVKKTDGLVDETRGELGKWLDGCEYLQVLGQAYKLAQPFKKIENVRFGDLPKGERVMIRPGVEAVISECRSNKIGRHTSEDLVLEGLRDVQMIVGQREYHCFRDELGKLYLVHLSATEGIYERQRKDVEKLYPELVEKQMERIKDVQIIVPEEMRVIRGLRNKCRVLLNSLNEAIFEDAINEPVYKECEEVIDLLECLKREDRGVTLEEMDVFLRDLEKKRLELVSAAIYEVRRRVRDRLTARKFGAFFLENPQDVVSRTNARNLVKHFAQEKARGILELIRSEDVLSLGIVNFKRLFGLSDRFQDFSLLMRRMFPGDFGLADRISIVRPELTMAERNKLSRSVFIGESELSDEWTDEEKAQVLRDSKSNVRFLLRRLIEARRADVEIGGRCFLPAFISCEDIASVLGFTRAYRIFNLPLYYSISLLIKAIPDEYLDVSDDLVDYYLNPNISISEKARITNIFGVGMQDCTGLTDSDIGFVREKCLTFIRKLIERYLSNHPKAVILEQLVGYDLRKISEKLILNAVGIPAGRFYEVMRVIFPEDFGVLTREKWEVFRSLKLKDRAIVSRHLFSSMVAQQNAMCLEDVRENCRKALVFLEYDRGKPIFAIPSSEVVCCVTENMFDIFGLNRNDGCSALIKVILGKNFRKLSSATAEWCAREILSLNRGTALTRTIFSFSDLDEEENSISRHNARLVFKYICKLKRLDIEDCERSDLLEGFYNLFGICYSSNSDQNLPFERYKAILFRMYPDEYGRLNEPKLRAVLPTFGKIPTVQAYYCSELENQRIHGSKVLSLKESMSWLERAKNNWLVSILFFCYMQESIFYDFSPGKFHKKMLSFNSCSLRNIFSPEISDKGDYMVNYQMVAEHYTKVDGDDYRQFFWRNIVKFCGNPREFFDLEEQGVARFDECLEVLPEKWLEIGERILGEVKDGKNGDKVVKEAEPLQAEFVTALESVLRENKLAESNSSGWKLMFGVIEHPSFEVAENALRVSLEGLKKLEDTEKGQLKAVLSNERFDVGNAEAALEEMSADAQYAWGDLQDEINFDLRTLMMGIIGEDNSKLQEDYSLMSWREQRNVLVDCAKQYLNGAKKRPVEHYVKLFETGVPKIRECVSKSLLENLDGIENESDRLQIVAILPDLISSNEKVVREAGLEILENFASRMDTRAGVIELKKIIEESLKS